jgi:hypothetical protein
VEFIFTRHAKRRAKLYGITPAIITDIIGTMRLRNGHHEILKTVPSFKFPLKIVLNVEGTEATVITAYPLKKGKKK